MLFNINTLEWDDEILEELNIPKCMLPQVKESSEIYGETDPSFFGGRISVAGAAGDQQAALFGQACFEPGQAKNTYGTGCFTLMNVGGAPVRSRAGLVTTVGWNLGGGTTYALEGSVFNAGSAIQWLRDELGLIGTSHECDLLAESVPDAGGVYLVPAFTGLGAPYWDMYARGIIVGLTRGVTRNHIIRAANESIAYQCRTLLKAMEQMKNEHGYDMVILMLTDVLQEGTQLLFIGSDDAIRNAFAVEPKDNTVFLSGVMSRKKQVIPMLTTLWG